MSIDMDRPTMTVRQLREALAPFADDLPIYGYWDTIPSFELVRVAGFGAAVVLDVESSSLGSSFKRDCEERHGPMLSATGLQVADTFLPRAIGDCEMCDGYILVEAERPYCPTCARERRENANG